MNINLDRLMDNLTELGKIGRNEAGGIDRALGSQADRDARAWLCEYWKKHLGFPLTIDAIANLWLTRPGTEELSPIVIGSHHDAVPNGGAYDGALGVLAATEVLQTLDDNRIKTRHPIRLIGFTGEEPNPYNVSTLGSKVISGRLKRPDLEKLTSYIDGSSLQDCMKQIGGDVERAEEVLYKDGDAEAFIELHIEQGRRLQDMGRSVASVSCITGIYRENITFTGDANHAGTTVMYDRQDALLAACEFNLAFEKIVKGIGENDVVGTVGYLTVAPNAASIIPGVVELVLEIRTVDPAKKNRILDQLAPIAEEIEARRGVKIDRRLNLDQQAMYMDPTVEDAIDRAMQGRGHEPIRLVSMAGHDAANMQRVTKAGMVFLKSINGKSHCPSEYSEPEDIANSVNVLLDAVLLLDKEL